MKILDMIVITIYVAGCLLSYGRLNASLRNDDYKYTSYPHLFDNVIFFFLWTFTFLSWIGFITGVYRYLRNKNDRPYFFLFSRKDLKENYYNKWNIEERFRN